MSFADQSCKNTAESEMMPALTYKDSIRIERQVAQYAENQQNPNAAPQNCILQAGGAQISGAQPAGCEKGRQQDQYRGKRKKAGIASPGSCKIAGGKAGKHSCYPAARTIQPGDKVEKTGDPVTGTPKQHPDGAQHKPQCAQSEKTLRPCRHNSDSGRR